MKTVFETTFEKEIPGEKAQDIRLTVDTASQTKPRETMLTSTSRECLKYFLTTYKAEVRL